MNPYDPPQTEAPVPPKRRLKPFVNATFAASAFFLALTLIDIVVSYPVSLLKNASLAIVYWSIVLILFRRLKR